LDARGSWRGNLSREPREDGIERIPEATEGWQRAGKLVSEHVRPLGLYLITKGRGTNAFECWHFDVSMAALPGEHLRNIRSSPNQVRVTMHVNHVIQVARPASFRERAKLLGEDLSE